MSKEHRSDNQKQIQIREITYKYDPEAAQTWFDLCVNILRKKLISEAQKMPKKN